MELNKKTIQSLSTDASFVQMVENIPYYKEKHTKIRLPMNIISSNSNNNDVQQVIKNMLNRLYTKIIDIYL